ncbi:MAG: coenzyme F420-0:L-glutamate ligase [Methanomicrobiales archaeon]|nr:coenzyme F420-0:L-glutamate ligase [Methanomicrobiales archaeon]
MNRSFCAYGLHTGLIGRGDDLVAHLLKSAGKDPCQGLQDGDIVVIAESVVAMAEGRVICLEEVVPGVEAYSLAQRHGMDPRLVEVVLQESDQVVGGIPGFLLSMKHGTLLPNAGVDLSNAPPGCAVPLPRDPDASAAGLQRTVRERLGLRIGVIVADSRTHAMRLGCAGVGIGCAGIEAVIDERGRKDLFGRELHVTRRAVADCIASAAELLMGEADESVPMVVVRGLGVPIGDTVGVPSIDASECLFMGVALHADPSVLSNQGKTP